MIWSKVIEKGWITQEQYEEAQEKSQTKKQSIVSYMVASGWLEEEQADYLITELEAYKSDPFPSDPSKVTNSEVQTVILEGSSSSRDIHLESNKATVDFSNNSQTHDSSGYDSVHQRTRAFKEGEELFEKAPTKVGDYWIQEEIGRGGMGVVYRAYHKGLNQFYAVKLLASGGLASQEAIDRFHQEAKANAKLNHKSVVQVFNSGVEGSYHYIVMELISDPPLSVKLISDPPGIRESLYVRNTLESLQFAHEHGIIHRDIKLENIFAGPNGTIKLADFGLAKDIHLDSKLQRITHSGTIIGTPAYMSPEQVMGKIEQIDAQSDLYSVGICLYELLTKTCPFSGSMHNILMKIIKDDPVPPSRLAQNIHKDIDIIVMRSIEKDKKRRYPTAEDFKKDIDLFLEGYPILSRPSTRIEMCLKWVKRHRILSGFLIFFLIILLGLGVDIFRSRSFNQKLLNQHVDLLMFQIEKELQHYLLPAEKAVAHLQFLAKKELLIPEEEVSSMKYLEGILMQYPHFTNVGYGDCSGFFLMASRNKGQIRFKNVKVEGDRFLSYWRDEPQHAGSNEGVEEESFDCRERPWFKIAQQGENLFWTSPYMFKSSQRPGITCALQFRKGEQLKGVFFVDINTEDISVFLSNTHSIIEGILTFPDGSIFAYSQQAGWPVQEEKGKLELPNIKDLSQETIPQKFIHQFLGKPKSSHIARFNVVREKEVKPFLLGMFPLSIQNQQWCFWYVLGENRFLDPPPVDDVTLFITLTGVGILLSVFIYSYSRRLRTSWGQSFVENVDTQQLHS